MKILTIISIISAFALLSCELFVQSDKFSLVKTSYTGKELRLDGYYVKEGSSTQNITILLFYQNGVAVKAPIDKDKISSELKSSTYNSYLQKSKLSWGLYKVDKDNILYEFYYPSSGGGSPAYVSKGTILKTDKFKITESYRSNGSEKKVEDEIYNFVKFSPKPDSTNKFL